MPCELVPKFYNVPSHICHYMGREHRFQCSRCGTEEFDKHVEYDVLGYPVCPDCGKRHGPV